MVRGRCVIPVMVLHAGLSGRARTAAPSQARGTVDADVDPGSPLVAERAFPVQEPQTAPDASGDGGVGRLRAGLPGLLGEALEPEAFLRRFRALARDILAGAESPTHRAALLIEITRMALDAGVPARQVRQALFDREPASGHGP